MKFIMEFWSEFADAARQSPSLFFLPFVGAVKGIREEYRNWTRSHALSVIVSKKPRPHKARRNRH